MAPKYFIYMVFLLNTFTNCKVKRNLINIEHFGAISGDGKCDNEAFIKAVKKGKIIYIPSGEFDLNNIVVPSRVNIYGEKGKTIIKKTKGITGPIFQLEGDNIQIKDIKFIGNLFEEEGEWNHAINIRPLYNKYKNIKIENIKAIKMHGDGICIGAYQGNVENIEIINFETDSCYRNGISITAGKDINIINARLRNSGMFGIDLEIDNGSQDQIKNVVLQNILTCKLAIIGEGNNTIKNVKVQNVILDNNIFANLYPEPGKPPFHPESILLRSCQQITFDNITFRNTKFGLIKVVEGANDENTNMISFLNIYSSNNNISNGIYQIATPKNMTTFADPIKIKYQEVK